MECYIIGLVSDYIAMGWEYKNYILEYYESVKEKIDLPPEYKNYLESVLSLIRNSPSLYQIVESPLTEETMMELEFKDTTIFVH